MSSLRVTNNGSRSSSSSASQSPVTPVVEITRIRTSACTSTPALPLVATVKQEQGANEEIKEFAETAMNELLGWYGYGTEHAKRQSVQPGEAQGRAASASGASLAKKDLISPRNRGPRSSSSSRGNEQRAVSPPSLSNSPPPPPTTTLRASPGVSPDNNLARTCDWCHRNITHEETYGTTEGVRFCSESCFSSSRRASFKRAKTCDWCRHVRHAVSYVDFQEGATQLQFCSDKCLNQYKMQIFIKETQAHLEMNPHLMDKGEGSDGNLITPELWLKNCRSRSASPEMRSRSASPNIPMEKEEPLVPPPLKRMVYDGNLSGRPTITLAPVSKLLPPPTPAPPPQTVQSGHKTTAEIMSSRPSMKTMRKRRTLRNGPPVRDTMTVHFHQRAAPEETAKGHQFSSSRPAAPKLPDAPQMHFLPPPPNLFPLRHNLIPTPASPQHLYRPSSSEQSNSGPMHRESFGQQLPQHAFNPFMASHQIPPVTILVPCPIILPIPVPVPIPINIPEFLLKLLAASAAGLENNGRQSDEKIGQGSAAAAVAQDNDLNNNCSQPEASSSAQSPVMEETTTKEPAVEGERRIESDSALSDNESSEVIPKIKITRLSKRILTTRELSDSTRPLRKRKVDAYT